MTRNFRDLIAMEKFCYFKAKIEETTDHIDCLESLDSFGNKMYPNACFNRFCIGNELKTKCKW